MTDTSTVEPARDIRSRLGLTAPATEGSSVRDRLGLGLRESREAATERERGVVAAQVGQETAADPGLRDVPLRFDLGLSDTFQEKKTKFLARFPEGDFVEVEPPEPTQTGRLGVATGGGPRQILFRRNQEEEFTRLDSPDFEFLGDIADISGDLPQIGMEIFLTRGAGLIKNMLQIFAGGVTGEVAKEGVEELRGFQQEAWRDVVSRGVAESLIAGVAGGATVAVSGPINALTGRGLMRVSEGGREAQQAAAELGLPPLLPSQVANSPLIQKIGGQAQSTSARMGDYITEQNRAMTEAITRLQDEDAARFLEGDLEQLHADASRQIVEAARLPNVSLTDGGSAIQHGIAEYDNLARASLNKAYSDAREIATPTFNVGPLKAISAELRAGIHGDIEPALARVLDKIDVLEQGVPDRVVQLADGRSMPISGTDQLRQIKQQLWELKTPNPGEISRQPNAQAAKAFSAAQHVLKKPTNPEPGFVEAWQKADRMASQRFDTMDKLMIVRAMKNETPAKLADSLVRPNQVDNVRLLKETIPEPRFREFQDSAKANMVSPNNVDRLSRRLNSFDQATLDQLFSPEDQRVLREVGRQTDRLNTVGLKRAIEQHSQAGATVQQLVNTKNTRAIDELVQRVGTDPNSPARKSVRAGMMENIVNQVTREADNELIVDKNALKRIVGQYRSSGALRLLDEGDREVLANLERVVDFIPTAADTGTSLVAGEAVRGATELRISSILSLLKNASLGRVFTSPIFQRVALGVGKEKRPFTNLRVMGGILGTVADDLDVLSTITTPRQPTEAVVPLQPTEPQTAAPPSR